MVNNLSLGVSKKKVLAMLLSAFINLPNFASANGPLSFCSEVLENPKNSSNRLVAISNPSVFHSEGRSKLSDKEFDDTLPPNEGGIYRRYPIGIEGEKDPDRLPFVKYVDDLKISFDLPSRSDHSLTATRIDLHALLHTQFFQLLEMATAAERFYAIQLISSGLERYFNNTALREALYRIIWDERMDPNLGSSGSLYGSLFQTAVEENDPVLLKFILENPKFNLLINKPLEMLIENERFGSATILLESLGYKIPNDHIADAVSQLAYGTESFNPEALNIFKIPSWQKAISGVSPHDFQDAGMKSGEFPKPLLYAAINMNYELARAILSSRIPNLRAPATFKASYIAKLVHGRSMSSISKNRWEKEKFDALEKLISSKVNKQVTFYDRNYTVPYLRCKIDGNIFNVVDGELDKVVGDISLSEVLQYFLDFRANYLESN